MTATQTRGETTRLLGRTAAVVAVALFTLTLLAGFVGGMWRVAIAGATGHPMPMVGAHAGSMAGPGFQLGFGLPLGAVVALALPVALLGGVAYLLYRLVAGGSGGAPGADPALTELRTAYARGDLTDAEFESRRERLDDQARSA